MSKMKLTDPTIINNSKILIIIERGSSINKNINEDYWILFIMHRECGKVISRIFDKFATGLPGKIPKFQEFSNRMKNYTNYINKCTNWLNVLYFWSCSWHLEPLSVESQIPEYFLFKYQIYQ